MALARKKILASRENTLLLAASISLVLHLTIFSGWKLNQRFGWWKPNQMPAWLQKLSPALPQQIAPRPTAQSQVPLMFVDVDPALSVKEPPKETKFYGVANSEAASPKDRLAEVPDLRGKQDKVIKATENSKSKAQPLQPSAPSEKSEATDVEESKPREKQVIGDLAVAKPQEQVKKKEGEQEREARARPRKLNEVKPGLQGEKMKQQGGGKRVALESSFDAKVTSFGDYDREFIAAVQQHWYQLLEDRNTVAGKIVVEFRLNHDGRITELKIAENTTRNLMLEIICRGAIEHPAPYRKWPDQMRRELQSDSREVRFTFYYE